MTFRLLLRSQSSSHARAWHLSLGIRVPLSYIFNISSILVISDIQYSMNRNRVSDDASHVNDVSTVIKISKYFSLTI